MLLDRKDSGANTSTGTGTGTGTDGPAKPAGTTSSRPTAGLSTGQKLIVGEGISLAGEITACDRLVVEGTVKVVLNKTRAIEIAATGAFTDGKAEVEEAEISGTYEGELTVRGRLLVRATGKVNGTIRYGELEVERGGRVGGSLALLDPPTRT